MKFHHAFAACALVFVATLTATLAGQVSLRPGAPLPGITPADFERFRLGLDDFLEVETAEEGLGPAYNATSCAVCHNMPGVGGGGVIAEVRAAYRDADGRFRLIPGYEGGPGETLFHLFSTPNHACQPIMPADVDVVARRIPIPLFGAGLVEAIPDETIRALEDPDDRDRNGISGRAAIVVDLGSRASRVGRFGWKGQHATLRAFAADAYRNEMGITNELMPREMAAGISHEAMKLCDPIPDPEDLPDPRTGLSALDNFEAFMKFLAPLPRAAGTDEGREGERQFAAIGCTSCHVAAMQTGPSSNPLFDRKMVPLFSDLLLHDIDTGDGIEQEAALANEIRTPALWGLRFRRPLLHDGSAATVADAIERHGREAALAREGYRRLDPAGRRALLAFLNSL
jgi:CxxC motif-containing protein (DUF1111 family)